MAKLGVSERLIDVLTDLFVLRGVPVFVRTTARSSSRRRCEIGLRRWGAQTAFIAPGSPWENGEIRAIWRSLSRNTSPITASSTETVITP